MKSDFSDMFPLIAFFARVCLPLLVHIPLDLQSGELASAFAPYGNPAMADNRLSSPTPACQGMGIHAELTPGLPGWWQSTT